MNTGALESNIWTRGPSGKFLHIWSTKLERLFKSFKFKNELCFSSFKYFFIDFKNLIGKKASFNIHLGKRNTKILLKDFWKIHEKLCKYTVQCIQYVCRCLHIFYFMLYAYTKRRKKFFDVCILILWARILFLMFCDASSIKLKNSENFAWITFPTITLFSV